MTRIDIDNVLYKRIVSRLENQIKEHYANKDKRALASLVDISSHRFPNMRIIYDRHDRKVLVETKTL